MAGSAGVSRTQWASVVLSTIAVAWMFAPTFPMVWMPSPGATLITWHSWADPLTLGHAVFSPLVLLAAIIAAVVGWVGVFRRRATLAPVACCAVAVGLAVLLFVMVGVHVMSIVPILLLVLSGALQWRAVSQSRRTDPARG